MAKAVSERLFFVVPSLGVDGIIKVRVRDVNFSRINANDWSLTVLLDEINPIEMMKGSAKPYFSCHF